MRQKLSAFVNRMERIDIKIISCIFMLNIFGLLMVYSASSYGCSLSQEYNFDPMYLVKKQAIFVLVGFAFMLFLGKFLNYNYLKKLAVPIYIIGVLSLFLLFTGLGYSSHNATRWISLGPVNLQVSEITKLAMTIGLAAYFTHYKDMFHRRDIFEAKAIFYAFCLGILPAGLVFKLSDNLSTALIMAGIMFLMIFVFTDYTKSYIFLALLAFLGVFIVWKVYGAHLPTVEELEHSSFRVKRIAAWIDPERYAEDGGYQSLQSLYAVVSGGLTGKGLGKSVQKLDKIPEAQNDMIFAVVCEELGVVGAIVLLGLFVYLVYYMIRVAINSENFFGRALALGFAFHIALQVLINVGVVLMILPNTGVSLPFISYGGSAVFFTLAEMGVVLSIERIHMERSVARKHKELQEQQ